MGPEIIRDRIPLPFLGKQRAANDREATKLGIAAPADAFGKTRGPFEGGESRTREPPTDSIRPCSVGQEGLTLRVALVAPGVHESLDDDLHAFGAGIVGADAAAIETDHAPRGLHVGVNVDALAEIKAPIHAPAQGVDRVMGVLRPEAAQHHPALIGLAVPIRVRELEQFGGCAHVGALFSISTQVRFNARWNQQIVCEHRGTVGFARALGVFEDEDAVRLVGPRLDLRVNGGRSDPEPSLGIPVHRYRL